MNYVYSLSDPETRDVRYIGLTKNPKIRLSNHMCPSVKGDKSVWIAELRARNLRPVVTIIFESQNFQKSKEEEVRQIALHKNKGCRLFNHTHHGTKNKSYDPSVVTIKVSFSPENLRKLLKISREDFCSIGEAANRLVGGIGERRGFEQTPNE